MGWGIVGCGWVARDHLLPGLRAVPGLRLVAACDRDPAAAARLAAAATPAPPGEFRAPPGELRVPAGESRVPAGELRGPAGEFRAPSGESRVPPGRSSRPGRAADPLVTTDVDALLAAPGLDAVYVATPNSAHRAAVEAVAARGLPVLCEKPMAADVDDAEAIAAACAGGLAGTAFDQRFHPAHRRIAEIVAAGELGVVTAVRIVYACWLPPDWTPDGAAPEQVGSAGPQSGHPTSEVVADQPRHTNWRVDPARAGGGALVDLAPHGIDLVGALLGGDDLDILDVLLQRRVHAYPVDDGAVLAGRTGGGVLFSGHVAFNTPDAYPRRRLEVVGTRAQLVAEDTMGQTAGGRLTRTAADGTVTDVPFDASTSPFAAQLAAFSAAVTGDGGWPWPLERDLRLHRLLHTAIRAAERA